MFGDTFTVPRGSDFDLSFRVMAVNGLDTVEVVRNGEVVAAREFQGDTLVSDLAFRFTISANSWYSLVVTDAEGKHAVSNPIWVTVAEGPAVEDLPKTVPLPATR